MSIGRLIKLFDVTNHINWLETGFFDLLCHCKFAMEFLCFFDWQCSFVRMKHSKCIFSTHDLFNQVCRFFLLDLLFQEIKMCMHTMVHPFKVYQQSETKVRKTPSKAFTKTQKCEVNHDLLILDGHKRITVRLYTAQRRTRISSPLWIAFETT